MSDETQATATVPAEYIKIIVRRMYDAQKLRIQSDLRMQRLVRDGIVVKEDIENTFAKALELECETEQEYERIVWREIKNIPIVVQWLSRVRGIGPRLSGLLVAIIGDIGRFSNTGKLWAYAGLHVKRHCRDCGSTELDEGKLREGPRAGGPGLIVSPICRDCGSENIPGRAATREKGKKANWSAELKMTCWKIAQSFVKCGGPYRDLYDTYKAYLIAREVRNGNVIWKTDKKAWAGMVCGANDAVPSKLVAAHAPKGADTTPPTKQPEWTLGRINNMALRRTAKLFLSHLWAVWRELEGLEVTQPFVQARLGHESMIDPWDMIDPAGVSGG